MSCDRVCVEPSILYFGTPVVLICTENEDGTANLAPMSSAWWLGWRCTLGLSANSRPPKTSSAPARASSTCRRSTRLPRWIGSRA